MLFTGPRCLGSRRLHEHESGQLVTYKPLPPAQTNQATAVKYAVCLRVLGLNIFRCAAALRAAWEETVGIFDCGSHEGEINGKLTMAWGEDGHETVFTLMPKQSSRQLLIDFLPPRQLSTLAPDQPALGDPPAAEIMEDLFVAGTTPFAISQLVEFAGPAAGRIPPIAFQHFPGKCRLAACSLLTARLMIPSCGRSLIFPTLPQTFTHIPPPECLITIQ
jgi:hypothetical protein